MHVGCYGNAGAIMACSTTSGRVLEGWGESMAGIAASIRKALTDFDLGDTDFSMMHACMAVDGTAKKHYPEVKQVGLRFARLLRDNYEILGPLGVPGIDIENTRWPVSIRSASASGGQADIADLIYGIHRCTHGHGDDLPEGFALLKEANNEDQVASLIASSGKVQLSDCIIFALLAICVVSPLNVGMRISSGFLTYRNDIFVINDWWGKRAEFLEVIRRHRHPVVKIDFAHLMPVRG
jgi:hypothetical protein